MIKLWNKTTLGEILGNRGSSINPGKEPDQLFELYSVPSFPNGQPEIIPGKEIGSNKQRVIPESVLLCKINPRINRSWVVGDFSRYPKIASTEWIVFPPNHLINPHFLKYYLSQNSIRDFMAANASGVGGSLMRVKPTTIQDLPFSFPERKEQDSIVAEIEKQFTRLDAGVAALKRLQANLKRYRASVLKAACEGKLVPTEAELARKEGRGYEPASVLLERILRERREKWEKENAGKGKKKYVEPKAPDVSNLPELPEGWCWATVEQISILITDGDHNPPPRIEKGTPHLTAKNIKYSKIDFDNCSYISEKNAERVFKRYKPLEGDLIITCVGTVGRSAIVPQNIYFSPDRNLAAVRFVQADVLNKYTEIFINSPKSQEILKNISGSTAQPHLYLGDIRAFHVPIPPRKEQIWIIGEIQKILSIIEELELTISANLKRAERLRQAVLKRAFESEL